MSYSFFLVVFAYSPMQYEPIVQDDMVVEEVSDRLIANYPWENLEMVIISIDMMTMVEFSIF